MRLAHYDTEVYSFDYSCATIYIDTIRCSNEDRRFSVNAILSSGKTYTLFDTSNRDEAIALIRLLDAYNEEYRSNAVIQIPSEKLLSEFMEDEENFMDKYF